MLNAYIYDGLRSPIGRHAGELASVRPDDLAAAVLQKLLEKTGVPGAAIEDVILGDTNQGGEDSRNVARNALLIAGLPVTVPGQTVNRLCASGLGAVIDSARAKLTQDVIGTFAKSAARTLGGPTGQKLVHFRILGICLFPP